MNVNVNNKYTLLNEKNESVNKEVNDTNIPPCDVRTISAVISQKTEVGFSKKESILDLLMQENDTFASENDLSKITAEIVTSENEEGLIRTEVTISETLHTHLTKNSDDIESDPKVYSPGPVIIEKIHNEQTEKCETLEDEKINSTNTNELCDGKFTLYVLNEDESVELDDAHEQFINRFENFIFQGGGIRGIAFGGSIKYAEDHNLLKNIKRFAGSSAGSIIAAGLAVGYTGDEIIKVLHQTNFEDFKDDSFGVIFDIWRFINEYGVYKGDKFLDWIENILFQKTGNADITFKQIYDRYGKELVVTGTIVNRSTTRYFHWKKDPDMPVKLAIRISMSIPILFKTVKLIEYECRHCEGVIPSNDGPCYDCGKKNYYECTNCNSRIYSGVGTCPKCKFANKFNCYKCHEPLIKDKDGVIKITKIEQQCWNCSYECIPKKCENIYVDGGVLNNYPVWVFDGQYYGDPNYTTQGIENSKSIGFKLMTNNEKKDYKLYHADSSISGIVDFLTSLINSMSIQIERGHIRTGYWDKTVTINTHNVNWLEFNLPDETKEKLIQEGYNALHDKILEMHNFLKNKE